jgi:hypothetical protein
MNWTPRSTGGWTRGVPPNLIDEARRLVEEARALRAESARLRERLRVVHAEVRRSREALRAQRMGIAEPEDGPAHAEPSSSSETR